MVAVERTLPWRRKKRDEMSAIEPLLVRFRSPEARKSAQAIEKAYLMAEKAHRGQRRKSAEPYIVHPLAVAGVVASLGLDHVSIVAALLHDAVEDTQIELADIERSFGDEVAAIVDGVTKLDRISFESKEDQQSATFRKLILATAKDLRVLIVKLCDRLHNMRTLAVLDESKRLRIANESLELYAPLANRLGMQYVKMQLEELCFASIHPKWYAEIEDMVAKRSPARDMFITQITEIISENMADLQISAEVVGREKTLYSIWQKMQDKDKTFDEIFDLIGIRIIVDSVRDCYAALGSVHSTWKPIQGRFKDYIAMPKFNLYQSLHTTVVGPLGKVLEVQLRTHEMHERAESGAAAHYLYKEKANPGDDIELPWLARLLDSEKNSADRADFLESLKIDLEQEEIFIFTPAGELKVLPVGSTAIDFAYSIHTDVGHSCVGAKVDGRLVSLAEPLRSGAVVEIVTSKLHGAGPSRDWLNSVRSSRAASKIRQWYSRENRRDAIVAGEAKIKAEFRREPRILEQFQSIRAALETVIEILDCDDIEGLYAAVGDNRISAEAVAQRVIRDNQQLFTATAVEVPARAPRTNVGTHVKVEGMDDMLVRMSKCCAPVPGDPIMGFVTRGRGVSIHRSDCANAESLKDSQADRLIDVEWNTQAQPEVFSASLALKGYTRNDLLADISRAFADLGIGIISSSSAISNDRISRFKFEFEVPDQATLESLMRSLRLVDGVYDVARLSLGT